MFKKEKMMALALGMAMTLSFAGCGSTTPAASSVAAVSEAKVTESKTTSDADQAASDFEESLAETDPEDSIEEGASVEYEDYTRTVRWTKDGDKNVFGYLYTPADFDETKQYPVIIMSHGFGDTADGWQHYAPTLAANGYVCYAFDQCTGTLKSRSDGDQFDYSIMTEVVTTDAVVNFMKEQSFTDPEQLILAGQSMGGFVMALEAGDHPEEFAKVILFYPGFSHLENVRKEYPTKEDLPTGNTEWLNQEVGARFNSDIYDLDLDAEIGTYTGPVLLLHGTGDTVVPMSASEHALEVYQDARLVAIEGTNHGFPPTKEGVNVREIANQYMLDFLANQELTDMDGVSVIHKTAE